MAIGTGGFFYALISLFFAQVTEMKTTRKNLDLEAFCNKQFSIQSSRHFLCTSNSYCFMLPKVNKGSVKVFSFLYNRHSKQAFPYR